MPFAKVNYKQIYYKDWSPKDGSTPRATLVMVNTAKQHSGASAKTETEPWLGLK